MIFTMLSEECQNELLDNAAQRHLMTLPFFLINASRTIQEQEDHSYLVKHKIKDLKQDKRIFKELVYDRYICKYPLNKIHFGVTVE